MTRRTHWNQRPLRCVQRRQAVANDRQARRRAVKQLRRTRQREERDYYASYFRRHVI